MGRPYRQERGPIHPCRGAEGDQMRDGARPDPKDWARRILARADAGERINRMPLLMARQALGLA